MACVSRTSLVCPNSRTDPVCYWHRCFSPPALHRVLRKFRYLQNRGISLWDVPPNSGLSKFGCSVYCGCGGRSSDQTAHRSHRWHGNPQYVFTVDECHKQSTAVSLSFTTLGDGTADVAKCCQQSTNDRRPSRVDHTERPVPVKVPKTAPYAMSRE